MEHVGIVVDDLAAATAFFVGVGLKLQGEAFRQGRTGVSTTSAIPRWGETRCAHADHDLQA
jgi:catechol 2,3-dioxygenase-like lactoylglutathione lyase family enzyme